MTNETPQSPPFWPSRRLWLKLLLAAIYVPFLFGLLLALFVIGLFSSSDAQYAYGVAFLAILVGGPILVSIFLSPSWRGVGAGLLAMLSVLLVLSVVGYLVEDAPDIIGEALGFTLIAGSGVSIIEVVTRDVRERRGLAGLGVGLVAGFLLSLAYAYVFYPYSPRADIPRVNEWLFMIGWSAYFALVWLSTFFFPELFTRRVGWGGVVVWAGLVGLVFGVSFVLMK